MYPPKQKTLSALLGEIARLVSNAVNVVRDALRGLLTTLGPASLVCVVFAAIFVVVALLGSGVVPLS